MKRPSRDLFKRTLFSALLIGACLCSGDLRAQYGYTDREYVISLMQKPYPSLTLEDIERAERIAQRNPSLADWVKNLRVGYEARQRQAAEAAQAKLDLQKIPSLCKESDDGDHQLDAQLLRNDTFGEITRQGNAGNSSDACSLIATIAEKIETARTNLVKCAKAIEDASASSEAINDYRKARLLRAAVMHSAEENLNQQADQFKCAD